MADRANRARTGHRDRVLVLLFPGQGSQRPGMLRPWLTLPGAQERLDHWSGLTGLDLTGLGTDAGAEELRDTAVAQPILTVAALLSAEAFVAAEGRGPDVVCGHSVGELAAAAVAGVLSFDEAVGLAGARGAAMAAAAAAVQTGMAAVLGGVDADVRRAAADLGLEVATVNVAGQLVLGGAVGALDALAAAPPGRARVRRLDVAGAFHTRAMLPAVQELQRRVDALDPGTATCPIVANADGAWLIDGREVLDRLVGQLTRPVRFDLCLASLTGATHVVEVAPGGVLAGLAKRALPTAQLSSLQTPADLPVGVG